VELTPHAKLKIEMVIDFTIKVMFEPLIRALKMRDSTPEEQAENGDIIAREIRRASETALDLFESMSNDAKNQATQRELRDGVSPSRLFGGGRK
jgi:hypothetical protein